MIRRLRILLALALALLLPFQAAAFEHPGLLHSTQSVSRMRSLLADRNPVALGSYEKLLADRRSSASYPLAGPFVTIARDGEHRNTKGPCENDFLAAYYNALLGVLTSDSAHMAKSLEIIRAYAGRLTSIQGHDAPLCASLQGFMLINACELMRYRCPQWTTADTQSTEWLFRKVFLPVLDEFDRRSPYANGNWSAAVTKLRLAIGVYCNDTQQYQRAVRFYLEGNDNGALPNYIATTGQCQESGRDQAHCMLGLGQLAETCEVAWSQGLDLWSALDNRLLKGYEYLSRSNLGLPVPFHQWHDLTGLYSNWKVLSEGAKGQWRSVFEIAYNHYVGRQGLSMPSTAIVLGRFVRPEGAGFACDNPGFGSLLFYQHTAVDSLTAVPARKAYALNQRRPYSAQTEPVVRLQQAPRLTLVRTVDCWPEYWDLQPVRCEDDTYEYEPLGAKSRNGYIFGPEEAATTFLVEQAQAPASNTPEP